jgi:hypothetical protein
MNYMCVNSRSSFLLPFVYFWLFDFVFLFIGRYSLFLALTENTCFQMYDPSLWRYDPSSLEVFLSFCSLYFANCSWLFFSSGGISDCNWRFILSLFVNLVMTRSFTFFRWFFSILMFVDYCVHILFYEIFSDVVINVSHMLRFGTWCPWLLATRITCCVYSKLWNLCGNVGNQDSFELSIPERTRVRLLKHCSARTNLVQYLLFIICTLKYIISLKPFSKFRKLLFEGLLP